MTQTITHEQDVEQLLAENPGRYVAWNFKKTTIYAIAETYVEIMQIVEDLKLSEDDIWVDTAPGIRPDVSARPFTLFSDESPDVLDDIMKIVPNPESWLDTPNEKLWDMKPRDLIGTANEVQLRYMLRAYKSGIFT